MPYLADTFGRTVTNLRISVTDRCNFRCIYCMPEEGMQWLKRDLLLSFEEITRLVRVFASLGVTRIRLTGGEPLMRHELWRLIRMIRQVPEISDVALTTNGYFLKEQARDLIAAGLSRINVSLDSLDPQVFAELARRDYFAHIWEGIEEVERLGLIPIKLNVVLIRGVNDGEILQFAELARTRPFIVRFIEFMPIGKDDGWAMDKVVPTEEVMRRIQEFHPIIPHQGDASAVSNKSGYKTNGTVLDSNRKKSNTNAVSLFGIGTMKMPAERYMFADGKGELGFISSVSQPFCTHCDRVRITSDGKLRTCLFSLHETDLRSLLRGCATDGEIADVLTSAVWEKEEGHLINQPGFIRPERTMSQIGG